MVHNKKRFKCTNEGYFWSRDGDYNGSKNISATEAGLQKQSRGSNCLCCELSTDSSGLLKSLRSSLAMSVVSLP